MKKITNDVLYYAKATYQPMVMVVIVMPNQRTLWKEIEINSTLPENQLIEEMEYQGKNAVNEIIEKLKDGNNE